MGLFSSFTDNVLGFDPNGGGNHIIPTINHAATQAKSLVHNPASKILPSGFRKSGFYRNTLRPVFNTAASAGIGYLAGGPIGAFAAGALRAGETAIGGVNKYGAFQPLTDIVQPVVVGGGIGAATGQGLAGQLAGTAAASGSDGLTASLSNAGFSGTGAGTTTLPASAMSLSPSISSAAAGSGVFGSATAGTGVSAMDVATAVAKYGSSAMDTVSGALGFQASKKQKALAEQARLAALQGNQKALSNALTALAADFTRTRAAANAAVGSSGFISSRNAGGLLSKIEAKLAADEARRKAALNATARNQAQSINSAADAAAANASAAGTNSLINAGRGVLSAIGKFG